MNYTVCNLNPTGKKVGDCVVRAIAKAEGKRWQEVYDGLCAIGRELFAMPNDKKTYEAYLERNGWFKLPMPRFEDNTRYTVKEFADAHPKRTFIISVANHLTVVVDGTLFDTHDCSWKSVCNYWQK